MADDDASLRESLVHDAAAPEGRATGGRRSAPAAGKGRHPAMTIKVRQQGGRAEKLARCEAACAASAGCVEYSYSDGQGCRVSKTAQGC